MTSELKCPFCGQELHKDPDGYYSCYTDNCSVMNAGGNGASGTESLWTALIQAKQDLKIARKALKDARILAGTHCIATAVKTIDKALEQIEHKEQK